MDSDLSCPVCKGELVGPCTFSCGHTVCLRCLPQIEECHECGATVDADKTSPNRLLESILRTKIEGYDEKRSAIQCKHDNNKKQSLYDASERKASFTRKIVNYVSSKGGYAPILDVQGEFPVHPVELLYLVDEAKSLSHSTLAGTTYIISSGAGASFVEAKADEFHSDPVALLLYMAQYESSVLRAVQLAKFTTSDSIVCLCTEESAEFQSWLTGLGAEDLVPAKTVVEPSVGSLMALQQLLQMLNRT